MTTSILDLRRYPDVRERFRWDALWALFDGDRSRLNLAHECVDRHVGKGTALRIQFADGRREEHDFGALAEWSSRFANVLEEAGVATDPELSADDWRAVTQRFKELVKIHSHAPFPQDPLEQLRAATEAVFLSSRVVVMSARPGRITDIIDVDLPRPRGITTREEPRYFALVTAVREALRRGGVDDEVGPGEIEGSVASVDRTAAEGGIG